jgi:hypothetical protein
MYELLAGATAITEEQLVHGYVDLFQMQEKDSDLYNRMVNGYFSEGMTPRAKKDPNLEYMREEYKQSSLGKEINQIVTGKWNGIPHWALDT